MSKYVLETIDIDSKLLGPCPWHFNCSIIEHEGKNMLAYRCSELQPHLRTIELDDKYRPILETDKRISFVNETGQTFYEDPRLFKVGGELYISYTGYSYDRFYCWVGYNKVEYDKKLAPNYPRFKANSWSGGVEKNWQFFDYNGKPHFVYSINPHVICEAVGSYSPKTIYETRSHQSWTLGQKRGGTPPVLVGDRYYSFFHSRYDHDGKAVYYAGFYSFEAKPPFKILGICKEPIFKGEEFNFHDKAVVFPCGSIFKDDKWIVSYGYNDMHCKLAIIDHGKMLENMIEPSRLTRVTCLHDRMMGVPGGFRFKNYYGNNWNALRSRVPQDFTDVEIEEDICQRLLERGDCERFVSEKWI